VKMNIQRVMGQLTLAGVTALIGLAPFAQMAFAEDAAAWPSRPITMVVPFAAGGPVDAVARITAAALSDQLGKNVIVENVGGAGGMIGTARVAKGPRDGYQLVLGNVGTHAGNQTLYRHPQYNVLTDFIPVALVAQAPEVLLARKDFPASDISSFVAYAKANEMKIRFGSGGTGSTTHLSCALFNAATGIKPTHVPYRGGAPAVQDLDAGRIDYLCIEPIVAAPQVRGHLAKAIAVLSAARSPSLPEVRTAQEQGLAGLDVTNWFGVFAPTGTPDAVVTKLHDALVAALEKTSVKARLQKIGADPIASQRMSSAYFKSFLASEIEKWAAPIKANNLQIE
jgi:tripartite-type tricarboxylate transporter receptor subunit TctC